MITIKGDLSAGLISVYFYVYQYTLLCAESDGSEKLAVYCDDII